MDYLAYDIETIGDPWDGSLVCVGHSLNGGFIHVDTGVSGELADMLKSPDVAKVSHTQYDSWWLRLHGVEVTGPFHDTQVMAHTLNENQQLDLDSLVKKYLGYDPDKRLRRMGGRLMFRLNDFEMRTPRYIPWEDAVENFSDVVYAYNRRDVIAEDGLYKELRFKLVDSGWWEFFEEECVPFTEVLLKMQCAGIPVDLEKSEELREELEEKASQVEGELMEEATLPASFNIRSGDQLASYLFNKVFNLTDRIQLTPDEMLCVKACKDGNHIDCDDIHIEEAAVPSGFEPLHFGREYIGGKWVVKGRGLRATPPTEGGSRPSTDTKALLVHHGTDEWVLKLTEYRKMFKVISTYLLNFPKFAHEGRLYGRFNQTGTKTGRLSSSSPNLQNIPARGELGEKVRSLFEGHLVVADYSQLEPRLMAHFSGDPALLDIYQNNKDIYQVTAQYIFGGEVAKDDPERDLCKTLILALGYGAHEKKLSQILTVNGHPTAVGTAAEYLSHLQALYSRFFRWKDAVIARAKQQGYVKTLNGRFRRLAYQFESHNWRNIGYGERQAVNAIIQGSAGDIVQRCMMQTDQRYTVPMIFQVHDELGWDVGSMMAHELEEFMPGVARIGAEPAQHFNLRVPLVFEPSYCRTWAEKGQKLVLEIDEEDM